MPNLHKKSWLVSNSYYWILEIVMSVSVDYSTSWRSSPCKDTGVWGGLKAHCEKCHFWVDKDLCMPHLWSLFHSMSLIALRFFYRPIGWNDKKPKDFWQANIQRVHKTGCGFKKLYLIFGLDSFLRAKTFSNHLWRKDIPFPLHYWAQSLLWNRIFAQFL